MHLGCFVFFSETDLIPEVQPKLKQHNSIFTLTLISDVLISDLIEMVWTQREIIFMIAFRLLLFLVLASSLKDVSHDLEPQHPWQGRDEGEDGVKGQEKGRSLRRHLKSASGEWDLMCGAHM